MKFGHQFKLLRKAKHMTLRDVVKKTRIPIGTLSNFENGMNENISLATACKAFKAVGCGVGVLKGNVCISQAEPKP